MHRELGRKGVTLRLLWEEYHREHPKGYRYSRFCERYGRWRRRLDPVPLSLTDQQEKSDPSRVV